MTLKNLPRICKVAKDRLTGTTMPVAQLGRALLRIGAIYPYRTKVQLFCRNERTNILLEHDRTAVHASISSQCNTAQPIALFNPMYSRGRGMRFLKRYPPC